MANTNLGTLPLGQIILGARPVAAVGPVGPDGLYAVSFTDIVPPVRYDKVAWATVQIQQALVLAGPWTLIDTQTIVQDADPSSPAAINFTTAKATSSEGIFSLTFFDTAGASSQPFVQVLNEPSEIRPTVAELGAFMPARTVAFGSGGGQQDTFNSLTRPTGAEAEDVINDATSAVLLQTGEDIPDRLLVQAKYAVKVYAAMLVELQFYRNEVNRDQSAYPQYEDLFKMTLAGLTSAIADEGPAAVAPSFYSVPVMSESQARAQAYFGATNPQTGFLDPSQLPIPEWYPRGPGGIPAQFAQQWPWLGDGLLGGGDWEIADLESPD